MSLFKDRSDLRLSARYIYQQMIKNDSPSSQPLLTTVQSVKYSLLALFGEKFELTKSQIRIITMEEYEKLFGKNENETEEERKMFPAVDEALFVKIAERIHLSLQQQKQDQEQENENQQQNTKKQNYYCSSSGSEFFNQLIKIEQQLNLLAPQPVKTPARKCISYDAFLKAATSSSAAVAKHSPSVLLSSQSATSLWKTLIDCERIIRKEKTQQQHDEESCASCLVHEKQKSMEQPVTVASGCLKTVSFADSTASTSKVFPFKRFDPNQDAASVTTTSNKRQIQKDEECEIRCVSRETFERCFRLNERI